MALSEQEQELLAQLEKQLNEDPAFAAPSPLWLRLSRHHPAIW